MKNPQKLFPLFYYFNVLSYRNCRTCPAPAGWKKVIALVSRLRIKMLTLQEKGDEKYMSKYG